MSTRGPAGFNSKVGVVEPIMGNAASAISAARIPNQKLGTRGRAMSGRAAGFRLAGLPGPLWCAVRQVRRCQGEISGGTSPMLYTRRLRSAAQTVTVQRIGFPDFS